MHETWHDCIQDFQLTQVHLGNGCQNRCLRCCLCIQLFVHHTKPYLGRSYIYVQSQHVCCVAFVGNRRWKWSDRISASDCMHCCSGVCK